MSIQVIIKRKMLIDNPQALLPLLENLRSGARKQPGYIEGVTLRNQKKPEEYMVISTWETADDWEKWFQNKERRDLQGTVDSLMGERTFYDIYEPVGE